MPKIAYLFPGQGAQYVGMAQTLGDTLPAARKLFDELLVELSALRGEGDHAQRPVAAVDGVERSSDDIDAQHHAGAAAVGAVVHLA